MKKLLLSLFILSLLICTVFAISASAAEIIDSGSCGDNVTYTLDSDGLLRIEGSGIVDYCTFLEDEFIKSVVISSGVTEIGYNSFYSCPNLTSVKIENGLTTIQSGVFKNCENLTSIELPASITSVDTNFSNTAYYNDSSNWENGVLYIGTVLVKVQSTLSGAYSVKNGTTAISSYAFEGCTNLTDVIIPDTVTRIESTTFSGCSNLSSVTIHEGIKYIGSRAFEYCTSLKSVTLPDNLFMSIYAFLECSALETVTFTTGNVKIYDWAFEGCENIKRVNIPSIDDWCNIDFSIANNPLQYGAELYVDSIPVGGILNIPQSVTRIKSCAFQSPSIHTIILPSSIESIDWAAFAGNSGLECVVIPPEVSNIDPEAFMSCPNVKIYGYVGSPAQAYATENNIPFVDIEALDVYSVSFDANGGENAPESQSKYNSISLKLTNLTPTRSGYKFKGWATSTDGEVVYAGGDAFAENSDMTLYAVWEEITTKPGDPNGDGTVNMKDALVLRKYLAGWTVEGDEAALDVNGDGAVNMKDALLLRKFLAGWQVELG